MIKDKRLEIVCMRYRDRDIDDSQGRNIVCI